MPTDSGERRAAARAQTMAAMGLAPAEQQQLPCPRCDSVNTKFCYYNNYNLSQPRHFCKACRRYWTHGGTLRNVPVGGATRKNSKRSRSSSSSSAAAANQPASSGSSSGGSIHDPRLANSSSSSALEIQMPPAAAAIHGDASVNGSFTSLLSSAQGGSSGFLALGGLGLGLGSGLEEMGFGLGREVWAYPEVGAVVDGAGGGLGGCGGGASENAPVGWQLGGGSESGFGEADCAFAWPDLAISMSAKGFQ